jgi:hypothetical protein
MSTPPRKSWHIAERLGAKLVLFTQPDSSKGDILVNNDYAFFDT